MKLPDSQKSLPPDPTHSSQQPASLIRKNLFQKYQYADAKNVLTKEREQLETDAKACRSSLRELEIQTLLHLPLLKRENWQDTRASYRQVRDAVKQRASLISQFRTNTLASADLVNITPEMQVTRSGIKTIDDRHIKIDVKAVTASIGHLYQAKLHYLLSPRADIVYEWGLFEENCEYPLLYLGFTLTDPRILASLGNLNPPPLTLARAGSIVDLPRNAFSYTIAQVANKLREKEGKISGFVTAVNPYLGFTAASVCAGGFQCFATRPVNYWYDEYGSFTTRRFRTERSRLSTQLMPPNIQFFRKAGKSTSFPALNMQHQKELPPVPSTASINTLSPHEFRSIVEEVAFSERKKVAQHWTERTKHPDFIGRSPQSESAGQCGVTSVHVARALIRRIPGIKISYCYGDLLSSTDSIKGIHRHCWLLASMSGVKLVVDCTPDQEGGIPGREVLVLTDDELQHLGLSYEARTERTVDALVHDRVWPRYLKLADSITE